MTVERVRAVFEHENLRVYVRQFEPRAIFDPLQRRLGETAALEQVS